MREQLNMFRQLPPEKQEALRKAFDKFSKEPPERFPDAAAMLQALTNCGC